MTEQSPSAGAAQGPTADPRRSYHELEVTRVTRETVDACSVVFSIPETLSETFRYEAGQFLTLQVRHEGQRLFRCYSLASSPAVDPEHKVTIKRVEDGRISNWINDEVKPGQTLSVLPPAGDFVLRAAETHPLVFFGAGSGITPVISIIKTALATTDRPVQLLYANRDRDSTIFRDELEALAQRYSDRMRVVHRLDSSDGFLSTGAAKDYVGDQTDASFYVCGPGPFMDTAEAALAELGIAEDRIHIERFSSPADGQTITSNLPAGAATATATVHLDGATRSVPLAADQTILQAAKSAGANPPFSCESGFCGCCMAKLLKGRVSMLHNDFLSPEEIEEGWVLTCQSVSQDGDCEVEYPD